MNLTSVIVFAQGCQLLANLPARLMGAYAPRDSRLTRIELKPVTVPPSFTFTCERDGEFHETSLIRLHTTKCNSKTS